MLNEFRNKIDKIDKEIVMLLGAREEISEKIGDLKKRKGIEIQDVNREIELIKALEKIGEKKGLDQVYINDIFQIILKRSKKIQNG